MAYTPQNTGYATNTVNLGSIAQQNPGMTISPTGQVMGPAQQSTDPRFSLSSMLAQRAQTEATRNQFHADHPGATTMTTGQLYGVGAPNSYGGAYVKPDTDPHWNGGTGGTNAGWDAWAAEKQKQYGVPNGGTLGGTSNGGGGAANGASYGAGYTGFGGSSLTASGGPVYGGGSGQGGPGGGSGGGGGTPGSQTPYAGTLPGGYMLPYNPTGMNVTPRTPTSTYAYAPPPTTAVMPNLNTTLPPPPTSTTTPTSTNNTAFKPYIPTNYTRR